MAGCRWAAALSPVSWMFLASTQPYLTCSDTLEYVSCCMMVNMSAAARSGRGDMVYVLPLPVWPYAKHVPLPPLLAVINK